MTISPSQASDTKQNDYGIYLSWDYAKNSKDIVSLKSLLKNVNLNQVEDHQLEEIFFESVIFDEWSHADKISSILLRKNENNFSANLYKFFIGFLNNKDVDNYLERVQPHHLDLNFLQAMIIWKNSDNSNKISFNSSNCVPIICLHSALFLNMKGKGEEAQIFLKKIEEEKFASYRIKELLLLNTMKTKQTDANIILDQLNSHNLNLKKFDLDYLADNTYLLNPVENKKDGMAELLYNISSWFFSKELYKYSAFFGKISLRLRPNFNAMKLLLSGSFEKLGYQKLGINYIKNLDTSNLYYYKFLRIKLSLFESLEQNQEFLLNLREFTKDYPERSEMKVLLADKLRRLERYNEAIKIYSEIINEDKLSPNWNILYSRGIAYERINNWDKAEQDLRDAVKLKPNDAYILNYLAYSWLDRKKNFEEALELLKRAVEIQPSDAYIIDSLGWAFYLTDQTEQSIFFLEKAVSILPDDATLNDHLGDAYWKAGRKNEAMSQWKRVLILDPKFKKKEIINLKIKNGL